MLQQASGSARTEIMHKPVNASRIGAFLDKARAGGLLLVTSDEHTVNQSMQSVLNDMDVPSVSMQVGEPDHATPPLDTINALVIETIPPIIKALEAYVRLRKQGLSLPAIIDVLPKADVEIMSRSLRDSSFTGLLAKPFGPDELFAALKHGAAQI